MMMQIVLGVFAVVVVVGPLHKLLDCTIATRCAMRLSKYLKMVAAAL